MSEETLSERLQTHNDQLTNHLVGEVRTLLDAIISDERQAKAAKDMARESFFSISRLFMYSFFCFVSARGPD